MVFRWCPACGKYPLARTDFPHHMMCGQCFAVFFIRPSIDVLMERIATAQADAGDLGGDQVDGDGDQGEESEVSHV